MNAAEAFTQVEHDLRGSVGSLRLVLTMLLDDDRLADQRPLLAAADDEVRHVAAELAALPALAVAVSDHGAALEMDLTEALHAAAASARRHEVAVALQDDPPLVVRARPHVIERALPALLVLAAGPSCSTQVHVERGDGGPTLWCSGPPLRPQSRRLAGLLADALGWTVVDGPTGLRLEMGSP